MHDYFLSFTCYIMSHICYFLHYICYFLHYIFEFWPFTPSKKSILWKCQIFPKNKIFIKSIQKSVNLSPSNGGLVFVPQVSLIWGTWGTFIKCPSFWGTFLALWLDNIDHVIKITGLSDVIRIGPIQRAYINVINLSSFIILY